MFKRSSYYISFLFNRRIKTIVLLRYIYFGITAIKLLNNNLQYLDVMSRVILNIFFCLCKKYETSRSLWYITVPVMIGINLFVNSPFYLICLWKQILLILGLTIRLALLCIPRLMTLLYIKVSDTGRMFDFEFLQQTGFYFLIHIKYCYGV